MFTTQGGMDIEEVAATSPEALVRLHVDPLEGCHPWHARRLVYDGGVEDPGEQKQIAAIVAKLYEAFVGDDAMLCEINPLIVTPDGEVRALDSKFTVDDNALFRHPDIAEMRDVAAADPLEALAREKGVTYVKLDGEVGVLGNGAGLSMSTVDVVTFAGGRPANFCDLGGGGDAQGVVDALEVITRDDAGDARSSSTSSAGSPAATRSRAASCRRVGRWGSSCRSSSASTGRTPRRAVASSPRRRSPTCTWRRRCSTARGARWSWRPDGDPRRLPTRGSSSRASPAPRAASTGSATARTARTSSPASRPGKGGQDVEGIPVFDTVAAAVAEAGANTAMVFVPAPFAADAMYEAVDAGIETVICITEGVPAHEMLRIYTRSSRAAACA